MKKTLLLMTTLFTMFSVNSFSQTLTPNPVASVQVGNSVAITFNYTSTIPCALYAELRIANIDGSNVITQDYSVGSNYIVGAFSAALPVARRTQPSWRRPKACLRPGALRVCSLRC